MKFFRSNGDRVPSHVEDMATEAREGRMDRREFLALASTFGASTALAYSMLQRARFDASLVAKLQGELDHEIQGSLAFWRRAMQAHALMAILAWVSQAVLRGQNYSPLWEAMVKAIAYPG